tara:strand:- start:384 stop:860 length:477 start_codon:yes stop_codon:yes gene_type:complete
MLEKQITLAFALNNGYDSLAECKFHLNNKHLNLITDKPYKMTFYDENGEAFTAYPDFYDPKSQLVIEFKDYKLNTHTTKKSSEERKQQIEGFKGKLSRLDKLNHGWNHSMFKQAKVQSSLAAKGFKMLVVFSDDTKLSTTNKNKMDKLGLEWCYEREL